MKSPTASEPWPVAKKWHAHMKQRQRENRERSVPAENWMADMLARYLPHVKWTRQATWGFRVYDFWCSKRGIAIEVDGATHDADREIVRDQLDWHRSGILVLRVKNYDDNGAIEAIDQVARNTSWNQRRAKLGKERIRGAD
jgi:very-short-patch-repair endonuclease